MVLTIPYQNKVRDCIKSEYFPALKRGAVALLYMMELISVVQHMLCMQKPHVQFWASVGPGWEEEPSMNPRRVTVSYVGNTEQDLPMSHSAEGKCL